MRQSKIVPPPNWDFKVLISKKTPSSNLPLLAHPIRRLNISYMATKRGRIHS
jgi:hypothetical protein